MSLVRFNLYIFKVKQSFIVSQTVSCPIVSLRSKRFLASSSRELGREQKKRNDGGGGGE